MEPKPRKTLESFGIVVRRSTSLSVNTYGMLFTRKLSLLWTTLNRMIGSGVWMGLLEEELEVEPPPEEDDEEEDDEVEDDEKKKSYS